MPRNPFGNCANGGFVVLHRPLVCVWIFCSGWTFSRSMSGVRIGPAPGVTSWDSPSVRANAGAAKFIQAYIHVLRVATGT